MRLPANDGERQGRKAYGTDEKPERTEAAEKFANGLADEFRAFWADEDGVGVIEVVLILVVLIGLVLFSRPRSGNCWRPFSNRLKLSQKKCISV